MESESSVIASKVSTYPKIGSAITPACASEPGRAPPGGDGSDLAARWLLQILVVRVVDTSTHKLRPPAPQ